MIYHPNAVAALEEQARNELRALTEEEALEAADRLLSLAETAQFPPHKEKSLGLIARQRLLYQLD